MAQATPTDALRLADAGAAVLVDVIPDFDDRGTTMANSVTARVPRARTGIHEIRDRTHPTDDPAKAAGQMSARSGGTPKHRA